MRELQLAQDVASPIVGHCYICAGDIRVLHPTVHCDGIANADITATLDLTKIVGEHTVHKWCFHGKDYPYNDNRYEGKSPGYDPLRGKCSQCRKRYREVLGGAKSVQDIRDKYEVTISFLKEHFGHCPKFY